MYDKLILQMLLCIRYLIQSKNNENPLKYHNSINVIKPVNYFLTIILTI